MVNFTDAPRQTILTFSEIIHSDKNEIHKTNQFISIRDLIDLVNITQELEAAGNVTIFSPLNPAFEKLPSKIKDVSTATLRRWILKHFIKGSLFRKDMKNGPVSFF